MKRDIANLLDQMSSSWLFVGVGSEATQPETDSTEEGEEKWSFLDPLPDD